jgi:hypothetical protein
MQDPEFVIKERERARIKNNARDYNALYGHFTSGDYKTQTTKRYMAKYPEKQAAANKSQFLRPSKGNHMHHWSYNEEHYKDVIELTIPMHKKLHRYLRYDQSHKKYRTMDGRLLETRVQHEEYYNQVKDL